MSSVVPSELPSVFTVPSSVASGIPVELSLLQQIAQQNYDIQEMKKTLANIQQNLEQSKAEAEGQPTPTPIESDVADEGTGEDITTNVDSGALGGNVKETSTEDPELFC